MNKPVNPIYRYRYGADQEIKNILQSVKHFRQECLPKNQEIYFEPISIYYLCSALLEIAEIPENPHLLKALQEKYEQAQEENKDGLLFTLEELFSEGWLQRTAEEWLWNNNPYEYERLTSYRDKKEEQMVMFLRTLKETPYKDGIFPRIYEDSMELGELLDKTRLSVEELIEKNILIRKENSLCINAFSREWEDYGERVLSRKYEEWNCAEHPEKMEKWIHCCEFFTRCWSPEKYIDEKEELFNYCLERLEREVSSWEQEAVLVAKAMQIASNKLQEKQEISIPAYGAERQRFIEIYFERWCRLGDTHSRRNIYYGICIRNYPLLGKELQQRFRDILKKPCFEVQYFHLIHWENEICTADCVEEVELFVPAICNMFHYIRNSSQKDEWKQLYMKQLAKPIWDICYNGLHQSNQKGWLENLAELLAYLYNEANCYRKTVHPKLFSNHYTELLTDLLQYYFKDISEVKKVDEELIHYLLMKLGGAKDHTAQKYLGVLMLLGKYGEQDVESESRKQTILNGLFRGVLIWSKLASERELLLSTISWDFFSEPVWHGVLVRNKEELIELFSMLSMHELENTKLYKREKSVILGVGRLALLGLYFKAICLTELRDKFSEQIRDDIEADFVNEFILCQNKWRLFSGENIRLGESSIVLSKCVQVLSFLSEENKVAFTEKIEVETAIDVAFWLEYVKDHYVKSKLLNILMNAQKEKLLEGIYFFPTLQHAVDNLLELCFIESESQEENSKEVEKMLDFVQYALKDFEEALSHKPESVREDYKEWQDSAYCRVLLLKNQKDEILSSQHLFYKGIVWLHSNQLEEVQEAKKIFAQNSENSVSWRSNYLIACVLEIIKKNELDLEYDSDLKSYEKAFSSHVSAIRGIYSKELHIAYVYGLFLYLSIDKIEKFWALYEQMPEDIHQDKRVSTYVIEAYLSLGNEAEAKKQLEQLQLIYGETSEIKKLWERIEKADSTGQQIERPLVQGNTESNELTYKEIRQLLYGLSLKSNSVLAEIMVDEDEFQRLGNISGEKMHDKHEMQVISMVCQALKSLQNYSVNLLHNGNVASEDAYNRTLKLLFNLREERFLGFRLDEQTQGGITKNIYRSGEQGIGRRDLLLVRKENAVALLEGIKLWRVEKAKITEHLGKLREYNVERAPIVIMPIYGHMPEEKQFWERYVKLLREYQTKKMFDITEVEVVDELLKTEFSAGLQYIVRTRHNYKEFEVVVYHIMINIKWK